MQAIARDFDPKHFKTEGGNLTVTVIIYYGACFSSDLNKSDDLLDLMDSAY